MPDYVMTISRLTVDKLGVKLYDKVSAVIAELVANSYDADATKVKIAAPMGEYLAVKRGPELQDKGYIIEIKDNGVGIHRHHIGFSPFNYTLELVRPGFQGLTFLQVIGMAVVNTGYVLLHVVQNLADHEPRGAHAGHVTGRRSS
jgi:hypothetical protein